MTKVAKYNTNRKGSEDEEQALAGYYAVDPSGHLVLVRPSAELEPGWRWASQGDLDAAAKAKAEAEKAEAEKAGKVRALAGGPLKK